MKIVNFLIGAVLLVTFISCSSDSTDDVPQIVSPENVTSNATVSTWRITLYMDDNKNETSDYTGYIFTFNANGSATAVKNAVTKNGNWSTFRDDSKVKFLINFGDLPPLDEISDDWDVLEITSNRIKLEDTSGDGSKDYLTFEKN